MRNIVTVLLVVAALVVAVGAASRGARVDVDYVVGTWHRASLLSVAALVAALVVVVGLLSAVAAGLLTARDRRLLEEELQRTYVRLRATEGSPPVATTPGPGSAPGDVASPGAS